MVGREPPEEEKIQTVIDMIKEHGEDGKRIGYKQLQELCGDLFEGVRLLLKNMKGKNIIDYEGMIPGFSAVITLLE